MAAFDPIKSGFSQMDSILDNIRLGDNVVWQITDLNEFRFFAEPFARQAVKDGRNVIYVRFAQHEPLLKDLTGIKVCRFCPDEGFEAFTVAVHEEITREGRDAFYVFDCLSELQSVWYTDLMMGNFFRVTCPYLFKLDTVAYFPILRGRHSFDAVGRIRNTTQLLLDVCSDERYIYLHPLKVWKRSSETMFLPHGYKKSTECFTDAGNGVMMSRYYRTMQSVSGSYSDQNIDSYDRFFNVAHEDYRRGVFTEETEDMIIASTMTKDNKLKQLVKKYFKPCDYFQLRDRMIGSGAIGGKACGMLLARKICEMEIPEFAIHNEPHDSFYIGSDVFYTYIVSNDGWNLRIRQRSEKEYFSAAPELRECLKNGRFPEKTHEQLLKIIEYYGQSPFIVRSSSFLEDGFGNAFAGKYESVFCVNQGTPEERLEALEDAMRTVYASTMDPSALEYRRMRGLDRKDEQMGLLIMRVSGTYFDRYFMPGAAGVGYSCSAYKWLPDMDTNAGMLRLVMGLGTKAVDRTKEDYPRLSNLDMPSVTVYTTAAQRHKYSQRYIDALDTENNSFTEVRLDELYPLLPDWYTKIMLEHDREAEYSLREMGRRQNVMFVSCQKLLENREFTSIMQRILKTLERIYENPVDIEYAINFDDDGEFIINLLQCRPLYRGAAGQKIEIPQVSGENTYFHVKDSCMGKSGRRKIDIVIQIDPVLYYNYPNAYKSQAAFAVGKINNYYRGQGRGILLMTPGRIGTSSPELGVPVSFADISGFSVICELAESRVGYRPELSYGSHIFQDLVESEIVYAAVFQNEKTLFYHESFPEETLNGVNDRFAEIVPDQQQLKNMIRVWEFSDLYFRLDNNSGEALCARESE